MKPQKTRPLDYFIAPIYLAFMLAMIVVFAWFHDKSSRKR